MGSSNSTCNNIDGVLFPHEYKNFRDDRGQEYVSAVGLYPENKNACNQTDRKSTAKGNSGQIYIYKPNPQYIGPPNPLTTEQQNDSNKVATYNDSYNKFKQQAFDTGSYCNVNNTKCNNPKYNTVKYKYEYDTNNKTTATKEYNSVLSPTTEFVKYNKPIVAYDQNSDACYLDDSTKIYNPAYSQPDSKYIFAGKMHYLPLMTQNLTVPGMTLGSDGNSDTNVYMQTIKRTYEGSLFPDFRITTGPNSEELTSKPKNLISSTSAKYSSILLSPFTTSDDMYYFNDNVFEGWLNQIQQTAYLQTILDDIRTVIEDNLNLVLLNRVNKVLGKLVPKLDDSTTFVDVPFGPPLINVTGSNLLPYKYYYPNFKVENIDPKYSSYPLSNTSNVNVINNIIPDKSSKTYADANFLDKSFKEMITHSYLKGIPNENDAICVTIPSRGCQILDLVSTTIGNSTGYKILQTQNELVYTSSISASKSSGLTDGNDIMSENAAYKEANDIEEEINNPNKAINEDGTIVLPRILVTFSELDPLLRTAYDNILESSTSSLSVPMIKLVMNHGENTIITEVKDESVEKTENREEVDETKDETTVTKVVDKNSINVNINTLTNSDTNKVFVYVSKSANSYGYYNATLQSFSLDKNRTARYINIEYYLNDANTIPLLLKRRVLSA